MKRQVCFLAIVIILMGLSLVSFSPGPAWAESSPNDPTTTYFVHAGDTLYNIAARYHLNTTTLAQLNGLTNPGLIYIGQRLIVPSSAQPLQAENLPVVHLVQPGETLFRIALQHGTTVWTIVSANQLENPSFVYVGQRLVIPTARVNLASESVGVSGLPSPFMSVEIAPSPVAQGSILLVKVRTIKPVMLQASFMDWIVPFASNAEMYYAIIGIHAMQKAGNYTLVITATDEQGQQVAVSAEAPIVAGQYGSEVINLPPEKQVLLDPALTKAEREKLWSVFSIFRQERYWSGLFGLPVQGKISSVFGTRRSYSGGPFNNYHEGVDFSAGGGTPVYAPASGVVVLAEPLTVRGNAVIIDHGWGVHSGFYHLSEISVAVGQQVKKAELVGRVGNTGLSTGAHLHWDLRVRGINVNPFEWTQRVIP